MNKEFGLHQKGTLQGGIVVHLDLGEITNDLKHDSAQNTAEESPGAIADAEKELADEEQTEEASVQGIAGERGKILGVGKR